MITNTLVIEYSELKRTGTIKYNYMSSLKVNGKEQELNDTLSVSGLIKLNKVSQPDMVSIQLNGNFVIRENYDLTLLKEGDEIDFLYFMGGGSH